MKKHEACHWINEIMSELRRDNTLMVERLPAKERSEAEAEFYKNEIAKNEQKLKALDMAGDALTRSR